LLERICGFWGLRSVGDAEKAAKSGEWGGVSARKLSRKRFSGEEKLLRLIWGSAFGNLNPLQIYNFKIEIQRFGILKIKRFAIFILLL